MKEAESVGNFSLTSFHKVLVGILVGLLMVVFFLGGKNPQNPDRKEIDVSQFVSEVKEIPVVQQSEQSVRPQEVIPGDPQISSKVAERLRAAGFSTQFVEIRISTQKEE